MKKKKFICSVLFLLLLLLCSCGKSPNYNTITLGGLNVTLNQSDYHDFLADGWISDTKNEPEIYEVEIEQAIHYEFTASLIKENLSLTEVTFFSEDPQLDLNKWKLIAVNVKLDSSTNYSNKIKLPLDLLSYETVEKLQTFLQNQFHSSIKRTFQDSTNYEHGVVVDGCYFGILFSENGERLSVCFEDDNIVNTSKTKRQYTKPALEKPNPETPTENEKTEDYSFTQVEERHSFSYKGKTYIVGKNKLLDFLEDGWTVFGEYQADSIANPLSGYEIQYMKRDQVVIGPLCFVNGSETETRQLKDCTLIKCTVPLNYDMGVAYDNTSLVLPYSLQATMNGKEIAEIFENIGDYACYAEERDGGIYLALGIVSPYNAGVFMSEDQKTLQYLFMAVNDFYAAEFAR